MRWMVVLWALVAMAGAGLGDELLLKDGSVVRGTIEEVKPNKRYVIRTEGGQRLTFKQKDVAKFTIVPAAVDLGPPSTAQFQKILERREHYCSPGAAFIFSAVLPSAGHAYAGNWTRGGMFLVMEGAAAGVAYYGWTKQGSLRFRGRRDFDGPLYGGIGMLVALRGWEIFDAVVLAKSANERPFAVGAGPVGDGMGLALAWRW